MKINTNYIPIDLQKRGGDYKGYFGIDSKPDTNSADFARFTGSLANKNYVDIIQNAEVRNKDASYIIGGRLFDAVVDLYGGGDYKTIQEALAAGKKRIFIRAGEYVLTSDVVVPFGSVIKGEGKENTLISANGYKFDLSASSYYEASAVSFTKDDATVTLGAGDFVSNLSAGEYLSLLSYGNIYKIGSITDATHLELSVLHRGANYSAIAYMAGVLGNNIEIRDISISGSTANLITMNRNIGCRLENIDIEYNSENTVIAATKIQNCVFDNILVNGGDIGISLLADSYYNVIRNCLVFNQNTSCINLTTASYNKILGNNVLGSYTYGIFLQTTSTKNIITGNTVTNCSTSGIEEDGATDNYNNIYGNNVFDSGSGVVISGANSIVNGDNL